MDYTNLPVHTMELADALNESLYKCEKCVGSRPTPSTRSKFRSECGDTFDESDIQ